jgi:hypothetical protein
MQNRIEELIKICTERVPYYPAGNDGHPEYRTEFNKQRFAELLIKECAMIANQAENNDSEFRCMYDVVIEHFGIKD